MVKLVERMAVNRIKTEMSAVELDKSLMGGIPGRGVDDAARCLGVLTCKARIYWRTICGLSVDIRKAFDRIDREVLWDRIEQMYRSNSKMVQTTV